MSATPPCAPLKRYLPYDMRHDAATHTTHVQMIEHEKGLYVLAADAEYQLEALRAAIAKAVQS